MNDSSPTFDDVTGKDMKIQGIDFELVSTRVRVEKRTIVHNKGTVPLRMLATSNSPFYTLSRVSEPEKATEGYRQASLATSLPRHCHVTVMPLH